LKAVGKIDADLARYITNDNQEIFQSIFKVTYLKDHT